MYTAGLSETMAKRYAGTFGAMATAFGFAESESYAMSTALTQLAGDVASFYNITQDEAYTKLKSVFTGETESLKELGVVMTQTALDSYALANGYGKTTSAMTEQEKVALRYAFVMDQLSVASGDFARTSNSWANQTRLLTLQFEQLKATIGQGLINALTPVIKVINTILAGLQKLATAFAQFTSLLFGNAGSVSTGTTSEELSDIADGYGAAASGAEDLADATTAAGKAAKKYLAGFDEITKIGDNATDAGTAVSDSAGTVGGVGDFAIDVPVGINPVVKDEISPQIKELAERIKAKVQELIAPVLEIDTLPLKASLANLGEAFSVLGGIIVDALEWAWFNILVPLAEWTIEEAAPAALDVLSAALDVLNEVLIALQPLGLWLWDNFLQPIAEWTGGIIVDTLNSLADGLTDVSDWISQNQGLVRGATITIGAFMAVWKAADLIMWVDAAGGIPGVLKLITNALIGNTAAKIANKAEDIAIIALYIGDYIKAFAGLIVKMAANTAAWVANTAAKVASTAAEWAQIAATVAWNGICAAATAVTTAFGAAIAFLTSPIGLVVVAIAALIAIVVLLIKNWDTVKEVAANVWKGIQAAWSSVANWFKSKVLDPLSNGFKGMVNGVIGFLNGMIQGIISGVNTAIRAINKLSFDVPDWIPGIGSSSFGFHLSTIAAPKIPYLAKGAVIPPNAPFMAVLGDQRHGTNVEAPLSTIKEAVAEVMGDMLPAMLAGFEAVVAEQQQTREAIYGIELGDDIIGRAAERYNRKMAVIRGSRY